MTDQKYQMKLYTKVTLAIPSLLKQTLEQVLGKEQQQRNSFELNFNFFNSLLQNNSQKQKKALNNDIKHQEQRVKIQVIKIVLSKIEKCEKVFGCHFVHSTFENSSGSSSSAINQYRESYYDKFCNTFSIFPNIESTNTIEIYNTAFSLHGLLRIAIQQCTFENYNDVIAGCLLQMNCSQHFPGHQNGDLRKLYTNLVPYLRQHFLKCAFTPIDTRQDLNYQLTKLSLPNYSYFSFQNPTRNLSLLKH
ncbi:unnamed protein product [Paramecium octaurelia]|uniref:Uncharacterized protein n=1 Tax=Paramecium octaurelia TaxID=43137 RepID=A0A8S1YNX8_PAROT|nr:unnamed protein product [Paramecium octaurelia]CAD8215358.1 unnamed protein product [Paramecium octaurelia]